MADQGRTSDGDLAAEADDLISAPHGWRFFAAVRRLQALRGDRPGVGHSQRIEEDVIRFSQRPATAFTPAEVLSVKRDDSGSAPVFELEQSFFGFFGPNGPLPDHITQLAMTGQLEGGAGDAAMLTDFLNLLQHRMTALLYRAWTLSDPCAGRDLGEEDPFKRFVDACFGAAPRAFSDRSALSDDLRRYFAGRLAANDRSASSLEAVAQGVIGARVRVNPMVGEWLTIPVEERAYLSSSRTIDHPPVQLGVNATLGAQTFSLQTRIELRTEPLTLAQYRALLPTGALSAPLRSAILHVMGLTVAVSVRPVLKASEIPPFALGKGVRLGWDCWLGGDRRGRDGDDLSLDALDS